MEKLPGPKTCNPIDTFSLFEGLDKRQCQQINTLCNWTGFAANQQIVHQDDKSTDLFLIAEGSVTAKSFSPNGKEVTFIEIEAGDVFGEFSAIDGAERSATVVTTTPSIIGRLSSKQFKQLLLDHPQLGLRFATHLVRKIRFLSNRVYGFGALAVRQRLHAELLRMCTPVKNSNTAVIDPIPTHYELATHIATHREAVSRELSKLMACQLLKIEGRKCTILDFQKLKDLVEMVKT